MEDKLLTVAEFAQAVKISPQAVYKQIKQDGKLFKYVIEDGKAKKIKVEAIEELYPNASEVVKPSQPQVEEVQQPLNQVQQPIQPIQSQNNQFFAEVVKPSQPQVEEVQQPLNQVQQPIQPLTANEWIIFLKEQLAEKDRQIERIQEEARKREEADREQIKALTALLGNTQHLQAQSNLLLHENTPTQQEQPEKIVEVQEKQEKKSLWYRLFH